MVRLISIVLIVEVNMSSGRYAQAVGAAGEELAAKVLAGRGVRMVERIATPTKLIRGRMIYSAKVSGDHMGILVPSGVRVLTEVKTIHDRNLRWGDLRSHQPERLSLNKEFGGVSLLVWVSGDGVFVMDWNFPSWDFKPGVGMLRCNAKVRDVMDVNDLAYGGCEHQLDSIYCCIHCGRSVDDIERLGQKYRR